LPAMPALRFRFPGSFLSHGKAIDIPVARIYQITGLYDNPVRLQSFGVGRISIENRS
jgi:hypothetical protein